MISLLKKGGERVFITHVNRYRRMMVNRELDRSLFDLVYDKNAEHIFIDLIEERFDILDTGERYITLSDAFEGINERDSFTGRIIPRDSEECTSLWEKSFDLVHGLLSGKMKMTVVESYLSERVGTLEQTRQHDDIDLIRKTNQILSGYYRYIRKYYSDVTMVKTDDLDLYFTDEKYEYGAIPSHLNRLVNRQIAQRIEKTI